MSLVSRQLPVTPHIRTCRICRTVRAFDPSGLEVNSAESDSAVRYRHGESRAHMGRRVRCWSVVGTVLSRRAHQAAPRDRAMIQVAAQLLFTPTPRESRRRSGPPDGCNAGTVSTGGTGVRPVSSNASLNHPVNHRHITAGKCISVERVRPECRQHAGRRQSETGGNEPKSSDQQQFSSPEPAGHRCSGAVSVIHQIKTE